MAGFNRRSKSISLKQKIEKLQDCAFEQLQMIGSSTHFRRSPNGLRLANTVEATLWLLLNRSLHDLTTCSRLKSICTRARKPKHGIGLNSIIDGETLLDEETEYQHGTFDQRPEAVLQDATFSSDLDLGHEDNMDAGQALKVRDDLLEEMSDSQEDRFDSLEDRRSHISLNNQDDKDLYFDSLDSHDSYGLCGNSPNPDVSFESLDNHDFDTPDESSLSEDPFWNDTENSQNLLKGTGTPLYGAGYPQDTRASDDELLEDKLLV